VTTETKERRHLPKLCGADVELGNFILGLERAGGTGEEASRALLREIEGLPRERTPISSSGRVLMSPRDWGRRFLPSNGGCVYIDLDHLEICLPEVLSAYDHVASWRAMLQVARRAMEAANQKLPEGQKLEVLVNNSDGRGNSYGSHLNFLITRACWENLFHRKMHYLLYLAAYQVSSIVFAGQGKVGSEDGPPVAFQLSQRADFFERITGVQTTFDRPLVNSRDEALCGNKTRSTAASEMARLHVIFYDSNLCQAASLLKVGVMQLVLTMLEADQINPGLILEDPLEAVVRWSRDPALETRVTLASGKELTAVEMQISFLEDAKRFAESGRFEGVVPRAGEILALWEDTLLKLEARDLDALAPRLDWVLKLWILERALRERRDLDWEAAEMKHLDQLYASLDVEEGLFWAYERSGSVEQVVDDETVARFVQEPPEDTRAWARAHLLRSAGPERVESVDWDAISFRGQCRHFSEASVVDLGNPLAFTREETGSLLREASLETILQAFDARRRERPRGIGALKGGLS